MEKRVASEMKKKPLPEVSDIRQVLHFSLVDTEYCIGLQHVVRVFPIVQFRYVPGGQSFLRGLMTLEGKSVPVIDLAERLGLPDPHQYHLETPIMLCRSNKKTVGIIVDEVYNIEDVDEEKLQMHPLYEEDGSVPFTAAIKTERGLSLLLDADQILDIDLAKVNENVQDDRRQA